MCGIAGILAPSKIKKDIFLKNLKLMSTSMGRRGPDNQGLWLDNNLKFGCMHNRLSIIDLSSSANQPMISSDQRYVLSYNGEIYNHLKIRREIQEEIFGDLNWKTTSDTETLLKAIEIWGLEDTLNRICGMFAFSIWDRKNLTLSLARDRFGEKPLYWGLVKDNNISNDPSFVYASDISAFESLKALNLEVSSSAFFSFVEKGYISSPLSIYQDIYQLEPGSFLTFQSQSLENNLQFEPTVKKWYEYNTESSFSSKANEKEHLNNLKSTLIEVIKEHSVADVPLGTFLSGGIDSSLVSSILQAESSRDINTYTISFPDSNLHKGFDEASYAKKVASYISSRHHEIPVTHSEAQALIPDLCNVYSEPFADLSQIPTSLLCGVTKKSGITVALTGDGGDELFGGYNRHYYGPLIYNIFSNYENLFLKGIAKLINKVPILDKGLAKDKKQKLAKSIKNANNLSNLYLSFTNSWPNLKDIISEEYLEKNQLNQIQKNKIELISSKATDVKNFFLMCDVYDYLPSDILVKLDRAAMYHSLETRAPLLDFRIAQAASKIPISLKIKKNGYKVTKKYMLKSILKDFIPEELFDRPKQGFSVPIASWLRGPLKEWAESILSEDIIKKQGFFKVNMVRQLWEEHKDKNYDHSSKLWIILMWQSWLMKKKLKGDAFD